MPPISRNPAVIFRGNNMRYTRKDARARFEDLCRALGKKVAESYADKGAWILDYSAVYGGFIIAEYSEGGGESHPVFSARLSAREFCQAVSFALRCIALDRSNQPPQLWFPLDKNDEVRA